VSADQHDLVRVRSALQIPNHVRSRDVWQGRTAQLERHRHRPSRAAFREVGQPYFTGNRPASTLVQVVSLARSELPIEVEAIVVVD